MVNVSKAVEDILREDVLMQDCIAKGYANLSAIARTIKREVEEKVGKDVKHDAIVSSLRRIKVKVKESVEKNVKEVIAKSTIDVRTDVAKISLERNRFAEQASRKALSIFPEGFIQFSESTSAITLIYDERIRKDVLKLFDRCEILEDVKGLAAIVVRSPKEITITPGCISAFYSELARKRINVEDTTSCYTDTIMVVKMADVSKAFNSLTELISSMRRG